jgi:hypothetical protein
MLFEMDPSIPEPKSDHEITLVSKLVKLAFIMDMVEEQEPKSYWVVVKGLNW